MDREKERREKSKATGKANEDFNDIPACSDLENAAAVDFDIYMEYVLVRGGNEEKKRKLVELKNEKEEEVKKLKAEALDCFTLDSDADQESINSSKDRRKHSSSIQLFWTI